MGPKTGDFKGKRTALTLAIFVPFLELMWLLAVGSRVLCRNQHYIFGTGYFVFDL